MSLPAPTVKVFIAGASYAGLSAALNLLDLGSGLNPRLTKGAPYAHHHDLPRVNFQITLVDERDGFLHLIGCPLALADAEYSKKCWVKFNDIPSLQHPNVTVLQGTVTSVSPATKTATVTSPITGEITTHAYDYLVAATGLRRAWPVVPQSLHRKQYLLEAEEHIHAVLNARHPVLVVGGGAVGIEMASEIRVVKPGARVTLAHSRDQLLSAENLPDDTKDRALECLRGEGVDVLMNHRLAKSEKRIVDDGTTEYDVEFTNGHKMVASVVIMAISHSTPTVSYLPKEAVNSEGFVDVRPSLHFPAKDIPNADDHFCGGDAIQWSGIKRCGGAMWHGYCIAHNIHQQLLAKHCGHQPKFMEIAPIGPVIGLAVGNNAVAHNPGQGTTYGPDVRQVYFRDDLAFDSESISNAGRNARADNTNDKTVIWNYMKLGKAEMAPAA